MNRYVEVFEVVTEENFSEERYLAENRDVQDAITAGKVKSGWHHFKRHGKKERRKQLKVDYIQAINGIRQDKAEKIRKIIKPELRGHESDEVFFDFLNDTQKAQFDYDHTDKVSSFFYGEAALSLVNGFPDGLILDCGAGFRPVYYENVVNYEIEPYPTTDVLGFAEALPFQDNSFDAVMSFAVLEHVKYPFKVAEELIRVLKPGGKLTVSAAFLQPAHGYPHHYFNMTSSGMRTLFENGIDIEDQYVTPGTGPISTLSWVLRDWTNSLPPKERKKFKKMRVEELIGPAFAYSDKPFVSILSESVNFQLASATFLVGEKKQSP
ncbi:MAG: SAM-dependent methyltransferase [Desulfobulbaceae bacterium]|nr:MAG: SAM-dependent methyltransferase [Desulfobulbaceae bacterium]